jgi:hypoxanthine-DNA glycosylase
MQSSNTIHHPFKEFIPKKAKNLILGSFPAKLSYDWYYGSKYSQFWKILSIVYNKKLISRRSKQELLRKLETGIADIISSCERSRENSLDKNLTHIKYNTAVIKKILSQKKIRNIYFTSRFVELKFRKLFKNVCTDRINLITLPSPSPAFAKMPLHKKVKLYKKLLPKLRKT